jgi:hypothetical protein
MKIIHNKTFTQKELEKFKIIIIRNCLTSILSLINGLKTLNIEYENKENEVKIFIINIGNFNKNIRKFK